MANFAQNFVGMWRSNFTIALGCCFEMSAFTIQGKAVPSFVRQKIIESWLEWKGPSEIGQELRLPKQTIAKIVDIFVRSGNIEENNGSVYSSEIQNKLVKNKK